MRSPWGIPPAVAVIALLGTLAACRGSASSSGPGGSEPVVTNLADDFHFRWENMSGVSTNLNYSWPNGGTLANITQSSTGLTSADSVKLIIRNAAGTEVYRGDLRFNGGFQSTTTTSGTYSIRVEIRGASGTIDFRVQRSG